MGTTSKKLRLKTLAPRLAEIKPRLREISSSSWRSGKTTAERGYGSAWRRAREAFLYANPLCVMCRDEGQLTPASIVDHREPHRGNETLFWDRGNWQSLCANHHAVKTGGGQ